DFLAAAARARGGRTLAVGLAFGAFGFLAHRMRRRYGTYLVLLGGGFTAGLTLIVSGWR
ncbi:1-acyl-sn-glycerol-3-phosphate acyltransferase, partial [Streptomyces sp. SID14478]|nr:1-acyl-sn-glycerol-3-phosphate acyltransferase [Streptomyces sp. SID14478]